MNEKNIIRGEPAEKIIETNLGQLSFTLLNGYEDHSIQIDGVTHEHLKGGVLLRRAIRIAKFLEKCGIGLGDSVSIMSENRLEFCLVPVASFLIGATFAPLNPDYTLDELHHVINLSKPKIIFASPLTILKLTELKKKYLFIKSLVLFGSAETNNSFIGLDTLIKGAENDDIQDFKVPDYDCKETVATILCSSGTTGLPKGVMCTHDNMTSFIDVASFVFSRIIDEQEKSDHLIGIVPFFHSFGFMMLFLNLLAGKTLIVLNKFKPKIFLEAIVKYKINRLSVPPPILIFLLKNPLSLKYDLSCLTEIISGAAPLSKEIELELKKRFKVRHVGQGYGMTETTLAVMSNPPGKAKQGSVGVILPGMMAKIIDENGNALGPNQEGELCLKGPLIMKGYVGDKKATDDCIDKDKWLHTGDVAYYDEDKYFFIVDRLKELIKYNAFQVPPAELESLLLAHPAVLDAAVIGLPDDVAGELPLAFVVRRQGAKITAKELQDYIAGKVSPQKQLRGGVRFIKEIPRNPTGKILRRVLKKNAVANLKSKL